MPEASRSSLLLAVTGAYLAVCCGYHDTPVASYQLTLPETAGAGTSAGGSAGAGATAGSVAATAGTAEGGAAEAGAPSELVCDPAYLLTVSGLTSRYRQASAAANWVVAERDCESDGGHLIVIDSDAENTWMGTVAKAATTDSVSSNQLAWIGLGDSGVEGQFRWVTGGTLGVSHWFPSEPNHLNGTEDCVEMRASAQWNDDRCNANLTYICECDGAPSAAEWCDTSQDATCGDCATTCPSGQSCSNKQQCM